MSGVVLINRLKHTRRFCTKYVFNTSAFKCKIIKFDFPLSLTSLWGKHKLTVHKADQVAASQTDPWINFPSLLLTK